MNPVIKNVVLISVVLCISGFENIWAAGSSQSTGSEGSSSGDYSENEGTDYSSERSEGFTSGGSANGISSQLSRNGFSSGESSSSYSGDSKGQSSPSESGSSGVNRGINHYASSYGTQDMAHKNYFVPGIPTSGFNGGGYDNKFDRSGAGSFIDTNGGPLNPIAVVEGVGKIVSGVISAVRTPKLTGHENGGNGYAGNTHFGNTNTMRMYNANHQVCIPDTIARILLSDEMPYNFLQKIQRNKLEELLALKAYLYIHHKVLKPPLNNHVQQQQGASY